MKKIAPPFRVGFNFSLSIPVLLRQKYQNLWLRTADLHDQRLTPGRRFIDLCRFEVVEICDFAPTSLSVNSSGLAGFTHRFRRSSCRRVMRRSPVRGRILPSTLQASASFLAEIHLGSSQKKRENYHILILRNPLCHFGRSRGISKLSCFYSCAFPFFL